MEYVDDVTYAWLAEIYIHGINKKRQFAIECTIRVRKDAPEPSCSSTASNPESTPA